MNAWILERFPGYGRLVVALALVAVPAVMLPDSLGLFNLPKLTLLWITALTAGWLCLAWLLERKRGLPRATLAYAGGAFLGAYLLATLFSQDRATSVLGLYQRYGGFLPLLIYLLMAAITVAFYWEEPGRLKSVPVAIALGSVPVGIYTIIQAAGFDWIPWSTLSGDPPEFPGSTLGNSNFLGGYLGITLPFIAYLLLAVKQRALRILSVLALVLALVSLWFSGSRGGMMAALGGWLAMAFILRERLHSWLRVGLATLAVFGIILSVMIVWHPGMEAPPGVLREMNVFRTDTFRLRSHFWTAAWRIFLDNPLLGAGPDTFKENYQTYHPPLSAEDARAGTPDKPHSIYLEYASSSGLLGLGSFLALIVLSFKYALDHIKSNAQDEEKALLSAFIGGLAAYLIQGLFSMDVPPVALLGWISLAGIAAIADPGLVAERGARRGGRRMKPTSERSNKEARPSETRGQVIPRRRRAYQMLGAVAALALMAFGMRPLLADVTARAAMLGSPPLPEALNQLRRANELHPWNSPYLTMATTRVFRTVRLSPEESQEKVFQQAHEWLERAGRQSPRSMFAALNLARVNELWAERSDPARYRVADRWWQNAVKLDPSAWRVGLNYGKFLGDWALESDDPGVKRKASSVLQQVSETEPDAPQVWLALGKAYILQGDIPRARIALAEAVRIRPEYVNARTWLKRVSFGSPAGRDGP